VSYIIKTINFIQGRIISQSYEELQETVDSYENEFEELLAKVNDVLTEVYEEEFIYLEDALDALIVEYHEALEEAENDDEED